MALREKGQFCESSWAGAENGQCLRPCPGRFDATYSGGAVPESHRSSLFASPGQKPSDATKRCCYLCGHRDLSVRGSILMNQRNSPVATTFLKITLP